MNAREPMLTTGSPRFADARLQALLQREGAAAAWQQAVADSAAAAADAVQGEFAVGLRSASGAVFLAVDRFAVHSLCYRVDGDTLRFAERADQLADAGTPIDPQAIYDYLYFHVIPSPRTIFKGIYRLPPGHCAWFEQGRLSVRPYWRPRFDGPRSTDFGALRDEFRQLLKESVASRIDTAHPACFLSGGTDSSTVAGMAREATGTAPASYSIGFEAEGYDEMEYARIAARHFRTEHHEYYVTPADLVRSIPEVASHYDQPFGNSSAVPAYYCARMAKADGVQRILAGDGGDELFGGNTRYAKQRVFGWYDELPAGLRAGLLQPLLDSAAARRLPLVRKAASYVQQARVPMPQRLQTYNLLERLGVEDILSPALLRQVDRQGPIAAQCQVWADIGQASLINKMLAFDWRYTLAENDLPKVVGTTGLAGLEVGFPLLDTRLLDFSLRLPDAYKLKGLKLRWFFKEALRGFLPDEILVKKKHGFGLPFGVWAVRDPALHKLAADSLHALAERGIVRPAFVQSLLGEHLPAYPGYYGEMVWIMMMLEQWLARHAPGLKISD